MMQATLKPHPDTPNAAVDSIGIDVSRPSAGLVVLRYTLTGDLARIAFPAPSLPARCDELWKHTCFEAFIALDGGAYYEFNAAPSTQWALYRFSAYRAGMDIAHDLPFPELAAERSADRFDLNATLKLPNLPRGARLGLSAVIEAADGGKSYWALAHPPGKPDFHHADGFALKLNAP